MTTRDEVRLLIPDLQPVPDQIFTDTQIDAFLALNGDNSRLAAAEALEVVASDEILTYKITRTNDHSVNGVTGAEALLLRAQRLRQKADEDVEGFAVVYPYPRNLVAYPEAAARPLWG